jgi:peroxiredoxin
MDGCERKHAGWILGAIALVAAGCGGDSSSPAPQASASPSTAASSTPAITEPSTTALTATDPAAPPTPSTQESATLPWATDEWETASPREAGAPPLAGEVGTPAELVTTTGNVPLTEREPAPADAIQPASFNASAEGGDDGLEIPFAEEGTPEWRLYEVARLMAIPWDDDVDGSNDSSTNATPSAAAIAGRRRNLLEAITQAGQIIAATHSDATRQGVFENAVHYLCSAHMELAIQGDAEHARRLTDVAEALYAAKPDSPAAVASASKLVELARSMAEFYGAQDTAWVQAHVTQARLFVERFPREESRAAIALLDAGRTCERHGLDAEALQCYSLLRERFADTPYGDEVAAVFRRMTLPGSVLTNGDFGGATIDGGFAAIEDFRGQKTLVAFWSSGSTTFEQDLTAIQAAEAAAGNQLAVIGVNLDAHDADVEQFLEAHPLAWPQIFDPDPEFRGTQNPVAAHYGIVTVPYYLLIDADGRVLAATKSLAEVPLR